MAKLVGFKHFENNDPDDLMQDMADWVNGETPNVSWIAEFHIESKGNTWHTFVKYVEEIA